jgi:hypothetical protein
MSEHCGPNVCFLDTFDGNCFNDTYRLSSFIVPFGPSHAEADVSLSIQLQETVEALNLKAPIAQ